MSFPDSKILLIGAGKMGSALLAAWRHAGASRESITILETNTTQAEKLGAEGYKVVISMSVVKSTPDVVVLAVKPQSMDALLPQLATKSPLPVPPPEGGGDRKGDAVSLSLQGEGRGEGAPLYLSIAAGKTIAYFEKHLPNAAVVRAMPNTPALIRKGISGLCANKQVTSHQKQIATALLEAAGQVVWLDDESQMDAVTAISGSGPAYVFLFLEALIKAGVAQGLPEDMATKLALYTVRGSVKLAIKSEEPLATLRKNVTSSGGTTEAALKVLMNEGGLEALVNEAVTAAVKRAKEM